MEPGLVVRGGNFATGCVWWLSHLDVCVCVFFPDFDAYCWVRTIILLEIFLKIELFVLGKIS